MAKARALEAKLARLRLLRDEPMTPALIEELRRALADASHLVVAEAAELVEKRALAELADSLAAAFDRFMIDPEESDNLCRAKVAIVDALNAIDYPHEDVFLRGVQHVQTAGVWNDPNRDADPSAPLRAGCALGLVRIRHPAALALLVDLLLDQAKVARRGAARALGASGLLAAVPLLRFKARIGDREAAVTAECLTGLMQLAPEESLPFLTEFLRSSNPELSEGAIFALADSRRRDALALLKDHWPQARNGPTQEVLLVAMATARLPDALDFLLHMLANEQEAPACAALEALAIHRHNDKITQRIKELLQKKDNPRLTKRFQQKFHDDDSTAAPSS